MPKNSYQWILSDVNIIRCRKTDITEFCLMLISSDAEKTTTIEFYLLKVCLMVISAGAEKPQLLKFLWCLYEQRQKNRYHRILSDVHIIRCRKTGIIEFCLMLISSDAVKRDIMEFSLFISSDAANRCHWILSDVNIVRCRKAAIIESYVMLTSSDAEKKLSWNSHCPYRYRTTAINEYSLMLILSDAGNRRHLNFVWC